MLFPALAKSGPGRHRRRRNAKELHRLVIGGVRAGIAKLVDLDLPLVLSVTFLCLGFIFMGISAVLWFACGNRGMTFLFTATGTATWIFACILFVLFPPSASPAHRKNS